MRTTRRQWLGVSLALGLGLGTACGKDSNGPGDNTAPTANFSFSCSDLACTFNDLSSDSDGSVASYAWEFGDGMTATDKNSAHTYGQGGDFSVKLSVQDDGGTSGSITKTVSVTAPQSGAPTASFQVSCTSLDCTFQDQSTDADGSVVGWAWSFGDGQSSSAQNPGSHHYAATGLQHFTVSLTVTDNSGLTSSRSADITVSPAAALSCNGADCSLVLQQAARVTVTLESRDCTARNNTFVITAPAADTLFKDGCYTPAAGTSFQLNNGAAYAAGTALNAEVLSGSLKLETTPALRVTGSYPSWTLEFDDGEDATPPEPDFNDLIIKVTATAS